MSDLSVGDIGGIIGGTAGASALVVALVKWLGGRVVQREDDDKKELQSKLEEAQKAERSISESLIGLKHDMNALRGAFDTMIRQVEARAAAQDKEISELRTEFKEEIKQLEYRLKQDMQRIVSAGPRKGRG